MPGGPRFFEGSCDEEYETYDEADHREAASGGLGSREGAGVPGGLQDTWDRRADLLPMASEVRGMAPDLAKQMRSLEKENARLKRLVSNQGLDMEILKEAAKGNW